MDQPRPPLFIDVRVRVVCPLNGGYTRTEPIDDFGARLPYHYFELETRRIPPQFRQVGSKLLLRFARAPVPRGDESVKELRERARDYEVLPLPETEAT